MPSEPNTKGIAQRLSAALTGRTRLYGIVGHPIQQTRSPGVFTQAFEDAGLDAVLVPLQIHPEDLHSVFPALLKLENLDGLVVTIPHKATVLPWLDRISPRAKAGGAASILVKARDGLWLGDLMDGLGASAAILARGTALTGSDVLLLGAGGAGSAIALEILTHHPARLRVIDPDRHRQAALIARLRPWAGMTELCTQMGPSDIVINASPVGMNAPDDSPLGPEALAPHMVILDCVTAPETTKLLRQAEACGATAIRGREMFDSQVQAVMDLFAQAKERTGAEIEFPL